MVQIRVQLNISISHDIYMKILEIVYILLSIAKILIPVSLTSNYWGLGHHLLRAYEPRTSIETELGHVTPRGCALHFRNLELYVYQSFPAQIRP
jgi:hypothetical protein